MMIKSQFPSSSLVNPALARVNPSAVQHQPANLTRASGDSVQFSGRNQDASFIYSGKDNAYLLSGDIDVSQIDSARLAVIRDANQVGFFKNATLTGGTLRTNGAIIVLSDSTVTGDLESSGLTRVFGRVVGNIKTDTMVTDKNSFVEGNIDASGFTTIEGRVIGNIKADTMMTDKNSSVEGNIESPNTIALEGKVKGNITLTGEGLRILGLSHSENLIGNVYFPENEDKKPGTVIYNTGPEPTFAITNGSSRHRLDKTSE